MASVYPNRKDGEIISFKFKAFLGRDQNGKQIFKCTTWIPTKAATDAKLIAQAEKEALIWERQLVEDYKAQERFFSPSEITFELFVNQVWLPYQKNNRENRATTLSFYAYLLKIIIPYLGKMKLHSVTAAQIDGYLDFLKSTYKTKQNGSLSPKTIRHHYRVLKLIFEYAKKMDYITVNPLDKVDAPKIEKHKVDVLSKGEVSVFIKELEKLPLMLRTIYTLLLTTGMRRGECFGLQWRDVDFENRVVCIERNVTYTAEGVKVGLPKTSAGTRTIPLTDGMIVLLTDYKVEEDVAGARSDDMFLFPSQSSPYQPHDPTYITKHMKRFMKRIGLPDMSPHDLRHTCASLLLQSGADIKSVQDILGHADASTTLNFYVRASIEAMRVLTQKAFDL